MDDMDICIQEAVKFDLETQRKNKRMKTKYEKQIKPQIQEFVNYRCTIEYKNLSRQGRKTLHNVVDKAVASIAKDWAPPFKDELKETFMLCYVKQKPVTTGMFTVLPQNYFSLRIRSLRLRSGNGRLRSGNRRKVA